jgi:hypothetical protein
MLIPNINEDLNNNTNRSSNNNENAPNANAPSKTQQKKLVCFYIFKVLHWSHSDLKGIMMASFV